MTPGWLTGHICASSGATPDLGARIRPTRQSPGATPGIEACVIRIEKRAPVQRDRLGVLNVAGDLNREGLDLLRQRCRAELAAQVTTLVIDFTGLIDIVFSLYPRPRPSHIGR